MMPTIKEAGDYIAANLLLNRALNILTKIDKDTNRYLLQHCWK